MEKNSTLEVLKDNKFKFKKAFGQNFITDTNLLAAIVNDANITKDDIVVEIGPGAGTLTKEIAKKAKKVYAFEIDTQLEAVLKETLKDCDNVDIIFKDIQKVKDEELAKLVGKEYKVVANLPYYITTPIIMRFLESANLPKSITVMVQKEVADRLVAEAGSEAFGAITLSIKLYGDAKIKRFVSRKLFTPQPNVDSSIVNIEVSQRYDDVDKEKVKKLIRAAFAMRRKTLVNNICSVYKVDKEKIITTIKTLGFGEKVRGEELDIEDYIKLANEI